MGKKTTIAMALAMFVVAVVPASMADEDTVKRLGVIMFAGGWRAAAPAKTYDRNHLSELIDGEAELFFPYGFKEAVTITYAPAAKGGEHIDAEVYELGTALDAFGAYSHYRDERSRIVPIGTEGFVGATEAMFYQDRFFIKLRLAGKLIGGMEDLKACSGGISHMLPPNKEPPAELELLNIPEVAPQTVRYVAQGLLGHDFLTMGLTAEATIARKPAMVFAAIGIHPKEAGDMITQYVAYLGQNKGRFRWEENTEGRTLLAIDPQCKGVVMRCTGNYVVGVIRLAAPRDGIPVLAELCAQAAKQP